MGYTVGSESHQILLQFLHSVNLTEDDAQLINLQIGDINASLVSGGIDAAVLWEPYLAGVLNNGVTYLVTNAIGFKNSSSVLIGKKAFLEKYPEVTARLLKVLDRSVKWSDKNRSEAIQKLSKRTGVAEASYEASFKSLNFELYLDKNRVDALLGTGEFLFNRGTIRKDINLLEFIDTSYLEKAGIVRQ